MLDQSRLENFPGELDWNDSRIWQGGVVPGAEDDVQLNVSVCVDASVVRLTGLATVASLKMALSPFCRAFLRVDGMLTVTGEVELDGLFVILMVSAGAKLKSSSNVTIVSGVLMGGGTIEAFAIHARAPTAHIAPGISLSPQCACFYAYNDSFGNMTLVTQAGTYLSNQTKLYIKVVIDSLSRLAQRDTLTGDVLTIVGGLRLDNATVNIVGSFEAPTHSVIVFDHVIGLPSYEVKPAPIVSSGDSFSFYSWTSCEDPFICASVPSNCVRSITGRCATTNDVCGTLGPSTLSVTISGSCNTPTCALPCQHGFCVFDAITSSSFCVCPSLENGFGWQGAYCDSAVCSQSCSGAAYGSCAMAANLPYCICSIGRSGVMCETPSCVPNCTSNGVCVEAGRCECNIGFGSFFLPFFLSFLTFLR